MAALDTAATPYLKMLMLGLNVQPDASSRQIVATWATKVAIMLTYAAQNYPPINPDQLECLYKQGAPPPGVVVWLATYAGGLSGMTDVKHITLSDDTKTYALQDADGNLYSGHLVSLVLKPLVVQVWIWDNPIHEATPLPHDETRANFAQQIWPASNTDLVWPPTMTLNNRSFYDLAMTDPEMVRISVSVNPKVSWR